MGCSSGTSSGSSSLVMRNSGSEEDLVVVVVDERKRKRMISNRESARRSRMRKQKHLDDLTAQAGQLRKENHQILSSITITTEHYLNLEAENAVMQAQASELSQRLESLNEIIGFLGDTDGPPASADTFSSMSMSMSMNMNMNLNNNPFHMAVHPIMASADLFQY